MPRSNRRKYGHHRSMQYRSNAQHTLPKRISTFKQYSSRLDPHLKEAGSTPQQTSKFKSNSRSRVSRGRKRLLRRKRGPKSKAPKYVLTLVGKILYRRLSESSLVSRGMDLVQKISSTTLNRWKDKLLGITARTLNDEDNGRARPGQLHDNPKEDMNTKTNNCNINARSVCSKADQARKHITGETQSALVAATRTSKRIKRHRARKVTVFRGLVARSIGKSRFTNITKEQSKMRRKVLGHPRKKSRTHSRHLSKPVATKDLPILKYCTSKAGQGYATELRHGSADTVPVPHKLSNMYEKSCVIQKHADNAIGTRKGPKASKTLSPTISEELDRGENKASEVCESTSKTTGRKVRNRKDMLQLGGSQGTSHLADSAGTSTALSHKMRKRRGAGNRTVKDDFRPAASRRSSTTSTSAHVSQIQHRKSTSPELSEWPPLQTTRRTRGLAKETAEEIVRTKLNSAGASKIARRRWADIAAKTTKENVPLHGNEEGEKQRPGLTASARTWASVAAANAPPFSGTTETSASYLNKQKELSSRAAQMPWSLQASTEEKPYSTPSKRQKKNKPRTGAKTSGREKMHVQKLQRKNFTGVKDCKDQQSFHLKLKSNPASPRKRPIQSHKGRLWPNLVSRDRCSPKASRARSYTPSRSLRPPHSSQMHPQASQHAIKPVATLTTHDSCGQNSCFVDNIGEVYTKRAGTVIALQESNHDGPTLSAGTNRNVNKGNKRSLTSQAQAVNMSCQASGATRVESCNINQRYDAIALDTTTAIMKDAWSGTDLCSQLSSMTFDTQEASSSSHTIIKSVGEKRSPSLRQPQQKKVSLRYRALLRNQGCPCPGVRAVSELNTRHRRADILQTTKEVTRSMQRRSRQDRQTMAHSHKRMMGSRATSPAVSTSSDNMPRADRVTKQSPIAHKSVVSPKQGCRRSKGKQLHKYNQHDKSGVLSLNEGAFSKRSLPRETTSTDSASCSSAVAAAGVAKCSSTGNRGTHNSLESVNGFKQPCIPNV